MKRALIKIFDVVTGPWVLIVWCLFWAVYDWALGDWPLAIVMAAMVPGIWVLHYLGERRQRRFIRLSVRREAEHLAELDRILANARPEVREMFGLKGQPDE